MFSKLLKHEWRTSRWVLGILSIAASGVGVLLFFLTYIDNYLTDHRPLSLSQNAFFALDAVVELCIPLAMFILVAYVLATQIILYIQFYRTKFTGRGYLTFTLPVKTSQIYWSAMLNNFIWTAISITLILVIRASCSAILHIDTPSYESESQASALTIQDILWLLVYVFTLRAAIVFVLSAPLACVTIGSCVCKRAKLFASFGLLYGVFNTMFAVWLVSILLPTSIALYKDYTQYQAYSDTVYLYANLALGILFTLLSVGGYLLTIRLMKHRLNLD